MLVEVSRILSEKCVELSEQSQALIDVARDLRGTAKGQIAEAKRLSARLPLCANRPVADGSL